MCTLQILYRYLSFSPNFKIEGIFYIFKIIQGIPCISPKKNPYSNKKKKGGKRKKAKEKECKIRSHKLLKICLS